MAAAAGSPGAARAAATARQVDHAKEIGIMTRIIRWLTPLLMVLALSTSVRADTGSKTTSDHSSVLAYAIAGLSTILILITICKPSRKSIFFGDDD